MSQTFCSQCGQRLLEGDAYCDICGQPVAGRGVAPAGPSTPDVSSPEPLARVQPRPVEAGPAPDSPAPVPAVSPPGRRPVFPWVLAFAVLLLGLALIWMGTGKSGWSRSSPSPATFSPGMTTSSAPEPQDPAPTATPGAPFSRVESSPPPVGAEPAPPTRYEAPPTADPGEGPFVVYLLTGDTDGDGLEEEVSVVSSDPDPVSEAPKRLVVKKEGTVVFQTEPVAASFQTDLDAAATASGNPRCGLSLEGGRGRYPEIRVILAPQSDNFWSFQYDGRGYKVLPASEEPAREDPRAGQRDAREMLEKYYELIDSDRFDRAYVMRSWRSRNEVSFDQFLKIWSNNRSIRSDDFSVVAAKPDRLQVRIRLIADDVDARTGKAQVTRYRGTISLVFEEGAWRYNSGEFAPER